MADYNEDPSCLQRVQKGRGAMAESLSHKELAKYAAQGAAIALAARQAGARDAYHGPNHIICGLPAYLYKVALVADQEGTVRVGNIEEHSAGQG